MAGNHYNIKNVNITPMLINGKIAFSVNGKGIAREDGSYQIGRANIVEQTITKALAEWFLVDKESYRGANAMKLKLFYSK